MKKNKAFPFSDRDPPADLKVCILGCICAILVIFCTVSLIFAESESSRYVGSKNDIRQEVSGRITENLNSISRKLIFASKCFGDKAYRRALTDVLLLCERTSSDIELSKCSEFENLIPYLDALSKKVFELTENPDESSRGLCLELESINSSLASSDLTFEDISLHLSLTENAVISQ